MFAWATGVPRVNGPVRGDGGAGQSRLLTELSNEGLEALHLALGGRFGLEVADEANADAGHVEPFASEVTALDLLLPAIADVDFPVGHPTAVANQEMVGHAVFHVALLAMKTIDAPRSG